MTTTRRRAASPTRSTGRRGTSRPATPSRCTCRSTARSPTSATTRARSSASCSFSTTRTASTSARRRGPWRTSSSASAHSARSTSTIRPSSLSGVACTLGRCPSASEPDAPVRHPAHPERGRTAPRRRPRPRDLRYPRSVPQGADELAHDQPRRRRGRVSPDAVGDRRDSTRSRRCRASGVSSTSKRPSQGCRETPTRTGTRTPTR